MSLDRELKTKSAKEELVDTEIVRLYGAPTPSEGYIYKEQGLDKLEMLLRKDSMIARRNRRNIALEKVVKEHAASEESIPEIGPRFSQVPTKRSMNSQISRSW